MRLNSLPKLVKDTFSEWREDNASRLSAALSYYTVFSLAPMLVLIIALVGLIGSQQAVQSQILSQVGNLVGAQGRDLIASMIQSAQRPLTGTIATVISLITLLIGALGAFGELQSSLNTIWEVKPRPRKGIFGTLKTIVIDRIISFAMILVIGFLLLVSLILSAAVSMLGQFAGNLLPLSNVFLQVANLAVSFIIITMLFAAIFKFLPDAKIAWKDVWLGAVITALLFTLGKTVIGLYLGNSRIGTSFGAAGALAIIMIWVYYSAQILFLGAEFTQVYANEFGSAIKPDKKAVALSEHDRIQQGIPRKEAVVAAAVGQADQQDRQMPDQKQPSSYRKAGSPVWDSHTQAQGSYLDKVFFSFLLTTQFIPALQSLRKKESEESETRKGS